MFDLVLIRWHIPPLDEGMSYTQVSAQRILEMPCVPQKSKWEAARTIQLAHKLETNETPIKTERFPKKSSLEENMGEIRGNMRG